MNAYYWNTPSNNLLVGTHKLQRAPQHQGYRYLLRLLKKSYYGVSPNFTYNKIKHLEAAKSLILGFSTGSLYLSGLDTIENPEIYEKYMHSG